MSVRSKEFGRDPYSYYRELRKTGEIHFLPEENAWLVVSYNLASSILRQPQLFSSSPFAVLSPSFHGADPPLHTAMRRKLSPFFTPDRQASQRDSIERHITRTLERLQPGQVFDAVSQLASPIPFSVACEWLGLREDLAARLHQGQQRKVKWSDVKPALLDRGVLPDLVRETDLPEAQLAELSVFFLAASYGSSRDLLLLALSVLIDRPDIVETVSADVTLVPKMVEEILRLEPAAHTLIRRSTSTVELGGHAVPSGSMIWISIGAANRDPLVFESPEEFRLHRVSSRHLAFGIGPHFCIGSPMARLESEMILTALLPYFPRFRAAGPMDIAFWDDFPGGVPSSRQIRSWPLLLGK